jgi:predicted ATP-dependent serine protease
VRSLDARLKEAKNLGFGKAIIPDQGEVTTDVLETIAVRDVREAVDVALGKETD